MGRVVKADELRERPDPLGRAGQGAVERVLTAHAETAALTEAARERVVGLALAMTRRIVGDVVSVDPIALDRIYERSLSEVGELEPVAIRVHPDDRAASRIDELAGRRGVEVIDDPEVGRAGCRVEADGVVVDATLDAALAALRIELTGASRG